MRAICEPGTSSPHMESGRREKRLKPELFETKILCLSPLTGAHGLRHCAFGSGSGGRALPNSGCCLAFARRHPSRVGRFIRAYLQGEKEMESVHRCWCGLDVHKKMMVAC